MSTAQVVCCGVGVAASAEAQNDACDVVAEIMAGYATDKYFADEKNTTALTLKAVVVPNVRSIKIQSLKGLHDATYAGHVESTELSKTCRD